MADDLLPKDKNYHKSKIVSQIFKELIAGYLYGIEPLR